MLDVIRSILLYSWRKYDYVIFVRYLMGTAYLPPRLFIVAYHFFVSIVPTSDFMFFLDVTPKEAYKRILQTRKRHEMFESLEELKLIRRRALSLALSGKWTIINADKSIQDIERDILKSMPKWVGPEFFSFARFTLLHYGGIPYFPVFGSMKIASWGG